MTPDIDRDVALKVLPATFANDKTFESGFAARPGRQPAWTSPHVVPILGSAKSTDGCT